MSESSTTELPLRGVVVGVDGSPSSEHALRWAAGQARLTGRDLHAVITWDVPVMYDMPLTGEFDWSGDAARALAKTVENVLGEPDASHVLRHVIQGGPARVLIDAGRDADLLVVGSRGHGGLPGLLIGSVSQHVIAHAACPLVLVHEHQATTGRIVVGVDGSRESAEALRWAAGQADLTGAELHAVLAWHVPAAYGIVDSTEADWAAHSSRHLEATVAGALDEKAAARVVLDVVDEYPATALLSAAQDADLLVVGSRGRGTFAGMLLGSVSRHVAMHASCPVVVHHVPATSTGR